MNKNFFTTLLVAFATISFASCDRDDDDNRQQPRRGGVIINGVEWARSNVAAPGTFAQNPENAGMFYQWNRRQGWAATGGITGWDNRPATGTEWERTNNPCPEGWRIPTQSEFHSLAGAGSEWITQNGVNGRLFGTYPHQIFLPAVGWRRGSDGRLEGAGSSADYWSSTQLNNENAVRLGFGRVGIVVIVAGLRTNGLPIRCVAE